MVVINIITIIIIIITIITTTIIITIISTITLVSGKSPQSIKKAMNDKTERQTEYKRTETTTKGHLQTMK